MKWIDALPKNRRRGSFPRCLLFMQGDPTDVAARLTKLVGLPGVHLEAKDFWMPKGLQLLKTNGEWILNPIEEAKVKEAIEEAKLLDSVGESSRFLSPDQREKLTAWWLARKARNTPNWDIASTCVIGDKAGLLLVEAKAHDKELKEDGKPLDKDSSEGSGANHGQIGSAIAEASAGLNKTMAGWNLSRDSHYQLANRFAWAWKIASMDVPVVLVYLGFVGATDVNDLGKPFVDCADWTRVVLEHSRGIVPEGVWGRDIQIGGVTIRPLIRVWQQEIPE